MLTEAASLDRRVHDALREFALEQPGLAIDYLDAANAAQFAGFLQELFVNNPALTRFNSAQKRRLFALWSKQEALDGLLQAVEAHPEWLEFAWPGVARHHAAGGEFAAAWQLVKHYADPPALPQSAAGAAIPQREQQLYKNPGDYAAGYALYRAQTKAGKTDDALATIRHFTAQPGAPIYFYYLQAEAWAAQENWEHAWQSWQEYEQRSNE